MQRALDGCRRRSISHEIGERMRLRISSLAQVLGRAVRHLAPAHLNGRKRHPAAAAAAAAAAHFSSTRTKIDSAGS